MMIPRPGPTLAAPINSTITEGVIDMIIPLVTPNPQQTVYIEQSFLQCGITARKMADPRHARELTFIVIAGNLSNTPQANLPNKLPIPMIVMARLASILFFPNPNIREGT